MFTSIQFSSRNAFRLIQLISIFYLYYNLFDDWLNVIEFRLSTGCWTKTITFAPDSLHIITSNGRVAIVFFFNYRLFSYFHCSPCSRIFTSCLGHFGEFHLCNGIHLVTEFFVVNFHLQTINFITNGHCLPIPMISLVVQRAIWSVTLALLAKVTP